MCIQSIVSSPPFLDKATCSVQCNQAGVLTQLCSYFTLESVLTVVATTLSVVRVMYFMHMKGSCTDSVDRFMRHLPMYILYSIVILTIHVVTINCHAREDVNDQSTSNDFPHWVNPYLAPPPSTRVHACHCRQSREIHAVHW